jgi:hypothetical protein
MIEKTGILSLTVMTAGLQITDECVDPNQRARRTTRAAAFISGIHQVTVARRCISCSDRLPDFYIQQFGRLNVVKVHVNLSVDKVARPVTSSIGRVDRYHGHSIPEKTSFEVPSMVPQGRTPKRSNRTPQAQVCSAVDGRWAHNRSC